MNRPWVKTHIKLEIMSRNWVKKWIMYRYRVCEKKFIVCRNRMLTKTNCVKCEKGLNHMYNKIHVKLKTLCLMKINQSCKWLQRLRNWNKKGFTTSQYFGDSGLCRFWDVVGLEMCGNLTALFSDFSSLGNTRAVSIGGISKNR